MAGNILNLYKKNVKTIPLTIPDFNETDSFFSNININLSSSFSPLLNTKGGMGIALSSVLSVSDWNTYKNVQILDFNANSGDCYGRPPNTFSATGTSLYIGHDGTGGTKSWIPFTVNVASIEIAAAFLILTGTASLNKTSVKTKIGCEASDDPDTPSDWSDLNSRILTTEYYSNINVGPYAIGSNYVFDITDSVQEVLDGDGWESGNTLAVLISDWGSTSGAYRTFASEENETYDGAILRIIYGGTTLSYVSQPDETSGYDTRINNATAATNYGTANVISSGEDYAKSNSIWRSLIKFPLDTLPPTAVITKASLLLTISGMWSQNTRTYRAYRLKRDWNEGQATWNIYSTGNSWETSGAFGSNDCEQSDIGSIEISPTESLNIIKEIELSPLAIQEMVDGTWDNYGFLIKTDTQVNDMVSFYSSTYDVPAYRPMIRLEYVIPDEA